MKNKFFIFFSILICCLTASHVSSNNLRLSNFHLEGTDVERLIYIHIDTIYWENSWRNDLPGAGNSAPHNYDAVWFFAKYRLPGLSVWRPAKFVPAEGYHQHDPLCEIKPAADSMGIFLYKKNNGTGTNNFQFTAFAFNGREIQSSDAISFQIFAVEMVYIPQDSFYVGGTTNSAITGQFCANDTISPYKITGEGQITLGGLGPNSLNNHNAAVMSAADDFNNTITKILPASYPKGYKSIFCMKYEVSAQQYADFLNSIEVNQANLRFADSYGIERNSIYKSGTRYYTNAPDRANNFMSWADGTAYADWIGLRPMSELEMEKIARGPLYPVTDEYAWGSTAIVQMSSINGMDSSGTETALPINSNCNYNLIDGGPGQPIGGPVRVGIFATALSDRVLSGASYYGVMEMSGNCWERPVSVGNKTGRLFNGLNGDGLLDAIGNANVLNWPNSSSAGSGFRMGNWFRATDRARVTDRFFASSALDNRTGHRGFRCVRYTN